MIDNAFLLTSFKIYINYIAYISYISWIYKTDLLIIISRGLFMSYTELDQILVLSLA